MVVRRENKSGSNKAETKSNNGKGSKSNPSNIYPVKKSRGVPSKYNDSIPAMVMGLFAQGLFQYEVAQKIGITCMTFDNWMKDESKQEFHDAVKEGKKLSEIWWVNQARTNIENKQFNSTLWIMIMNNCFAWRKMNDQVIDDRVIKQEIKHTIKLEEYDSDRAAKIGRILQEASATASGTEEVTGSKIN